MKSLIIFGQFGDGAIECEYARYLKEYFRILRFDSKPYLNDLSGIITNYSELNKKFIEFVTTSHADYIMIFKGFKLQSKTIEVCRNFSKATFSFNPDHSFIRPFRSSGGIEMVECFEKYTHNFLYSKSLLNTIKKSDAPPMSFLPFGTIYNNESIEHLIMNLKYTIDTSLNFVGNSDVKRFAYIKNLAKLGVSMEVYGSNWQNLKGEQNINVFSLLSPSEYYRKISEGVQLNILRDHNFLSHNMRFIEVLSVGGVLITPVNYDFDDLNFGRLHYFTYLEDDYNSIISAYQKVLSTNNADLYEMRVENVKTVCTHFSYKILAKNVAEVIHNY